VTEGQSVPFLARIARLRVPLGFLFAALALWLSAPTPGSLQIGLVIALAGEAIRVWAAGHLEKGREVTASGPYAFTRHPLYLGSSVIGIGLAVAAGSLTVAVLIVTYLALTLTAAIRTEERQLTEKFGDRYPAYREGRVSVTRRFSLERATRNREYRAVMGLAAGFALLAVKAFR
jgi:protein-S-isoprenylcysteine O-methyltransferase Ste14